MVKLLTRNMISAVCYNQIILEEGAGNSRLWPIIFKKIGYYCMRIQNLFGCNGKNR